MEIFRKKPYIGDGKHINSGFLDGLGKDEAIEKSIEWFVEKGKGEKKITFVFATGYFQDNVIGESQFQLFTGKMAR